MNNDGLAVVVVTGPLARYEAAFRARLAGSGYARRSARDLVRAMAAVSCWLEERGLAVSELTPTVSADLARMLADTGPVIRFLREIGEVPAAGSAAGAGATVSCYGRQARTVKTIKAVGRRLRASYGTRSLSQSSAV